MKIFYGTHTRLTILILIAASILFSGSIVPVAADEREPIMDLTSGGVDFFREVAPSIVQIYNASLFSPQYPSSGSGYVFDGEGHFITNWHVVAGSPVLEVAFYGDQEEHAEYAEGRWKATVIAVDPALDLAVCHVETTPDRIHPVRLGDSDLVKAGDTVATFGSPGGESGQAERSWVAQHENWLEFYNLNLGIISEVLDFEQTQMFYSQISMSDPQNVFGRTGVRDYGSALEYLFQTDSAINHGNSGGPCLNMYGEAIGSNTWGGLFENWGMSVPVNLLKKSITDLLQYGRVRRPWCGIALHPRTVNSNELQRNLDMDILDYHFGAWWETEPDEMKIYTVNSYSPAYEAGLREGDVLLRVDGTAFVNIYDVYSYFLNCEIGQEVVVEYVRNGRGMPAVTVAIAEKQTRYDGLSIAAGGYGRRLGEDAVLTMHMTY